ncbi:hypothetical protein HDU67_004598, partial [Dinochytrium kinnereticum]
GAINTLVNAITRAPKAAPQPAQHRDVYIPYGPIPDGAEEFFAAQELTPTEEPSELGDDVVVTSDIPNELDGDEDDSDGSWDVMDSFVDAAQDQDDAAEDATVISFSTSAYYMDVDIYMADFAMLISSRS